MTERNWEASARARLERLVAETVSRIRDAAGQIERDARGHIVSAAEEKRGLEFQTYPRVAGQVIHTVQTLMFNLSLESLIDAASDAEAARAERLAVPADPDPEGSQAGRILALAAMASAAKGWAEGSAQNEIDLGRRDRKPIEEQEFRLADILNMINDAAREVGVAPTYGSVK